MSNNLTMYARDLAIRGLLTPSDVVMPTTLEVALTKTIPPSNAVISQLIEPDVELYVRQPYGVGSLYWAPTGFGSLYNTMTLTWARVLDDFWGTIAGWALIDPIGQQVINVGSILEPYEAITGMTPILEPGTIICGIYD